MKPYQYLPIFECGESLEAIPAEEFCLQTPHAYVNLGAPYGEQTPFYVRQRVLVALKQAQISLQQHHPGWKVLIFDAYRPVSVQQFMVNHTFATALEQRGLSRDDLTLEQEQLLWQEVYQLWAMPSLDPLTPPPHSTGAALDVTLVDQIGEVVEMGSAIDELSPRSHPDYFANVANQTNDPHLQRQAEIAAAHRYLLYIVMTGAGFQRHPGEWWHFSLGDQMWAWLNQQQGDPKAIARYGRVDASA
jgi:zinc D-Ala-D-Ala dipeptidase